MKLLNLTTSEPCEYNKKSISYVIGLMDEFTAKRFENHLETCGTCMDTTMHHFETVGKAYSRKNPEIKEKVLSNVSAQLDSLMTPQTQLRPTYLPPRRVQRALTSVAAASIVLLSMSFLGRLGDTTQETAVNAPTADEMTLSEDSASDSEDFLPSASGYAENSRTGDGMSMDSTKVLPVRFQLSDNLLTIETTLDLLDNSRIQIWGWKDGSPFPIGTLTSDQKSEVVEVEDFSLVTLTLEVEEVDYPTSQPIATFEK